MAELTVKMRPALGDLIKMVCIWLICVTRLAISSALFTVWVNRHQRTGFLASLLESARDFVSRGAVMVRVSL
jgi:hypothetical protein